ncbi:MAG: tetraacyldisaccharide 4'-kinase [Alistipes sp.]|jgi:tetraacyldisaccharide 4'-kinase|nr:tetraacyldisaccharide 4'-kinase [Alistipes sp.]
MLKLFLAPLSWIYGMAIAVRNWLYDTDIRKSVTVDVPVVCVGNITVGGTGKTPMCEMLIAHFRETYNVGLISLGYGRRTRGYREVTPGSAYRNVGDEPKQIKINYPDTIVAVCKNRVAGIERMLREHPEVNLIIMDDGFQYRRLAPKLNIVMVDYTRPIDKDKLLPLGRLRDQRKQMRRAHYVVVTKCPAGMTPLDRRIIRNNLELLPFQNLSFTRVVTGAPYPAFPDIAGERKVGAGSRVVAMAGLGNPEPFVKGLAAKYDLRDELLWGDHHPYVTRDLTHMKESLEDAGPEAVIVTTAKDAVKFGNGAKIDPELRARIFVQPITMGFIEETKENFLKKLTYDVATDQKNSLFYSR